MQAMQKIRLANDMCPLTDWEAPVQVEAISGKSVLEHFAEINKPISDWWSATAIL